jgi:hypothetical protein
MTFWLIAIVIILVLILVALERGNSIKAAQVEAENDRHEIERMNAEEQRENDTFFAANGYPHHNDAIRVAAWGAKQGMSPREAHDALLDIEINDDICKVLDESSKERLASIRKHGWQAVYVALAFTAEQRSGQDFRPLHGMIWKDEEQRYFLSLTDMSEFLKGGCSSIFPLKEKSIPQGTFTIEKEQKSEWDAVRQKSYWVDIA